MEYSMTCKYLAKMRRIAEHMDVEQLGDIPTAPRGIFFTKVIPDIRALAIHHGPFIRLRPRCTYLSDQITQTDRRRGQFDRVLHDILYLCLEKRQQKRNSEFEES